MRFWKKSMKWGTSRDGVRLPGLWKKNMEFKGEMVSNAVNATTITWKEESIKRNGPFRRKMTSFTFMLNMATDGPWSPNWFPEDHKTLWKTCSTLGWGDLSGCLIASSLRTTESSSRRLKSASSTGWLISLRSPTKSLRPTAMTRKISPFDLKMICWCWRLMKFRPLLKKRTFSQDLFLTFTSLRELINDIEAILPQREFKNWQMWKLRKKIPIPALTVRASAKKRRKQLQAMSASLKLRWFPKNRAWTIWTTSQIATAWLPRWAGWTAWMETFHFCSVESQGWSVPFLWRWLKRVGRRLVKKLMLRMEKMAWATGRHTSFASNDLQWY